MLLVKGVVDARRHDGVSPRLSHRRDLCHVWGRDSRVIYSTFPARSRLIDHGARSRRDRQSAPRVLPAMCPVLAALSNLVCDYAERRVCYVTLAFGDFAFWRAWLCSVPRHLCSYDPLQRFVPLAIPRLIFGANCHTTDMIFCCDCLSKPRAEGTMEAFSLVLILVK
jgi:hypothetical protein